MRRQGRAVGGVLLGVTVLLSLRVCAAAAQDDSLPGEPRGERIAVVDMAGSLSVLESGSALRFVHQVERGDRASWSPDGTELVHSWSKDGAAPELYITGLDGASRQLTSGHNYGIGVPAWSPDGRTVAFDTIDQPVLAVPVVGSAVSVVYADGTGEHQLTSSLVNVAEPAWSPTGQELAVTGADSFGVNLQILVVDAATGAVTRRVTDEVLGDDVLPAWSPDGAFVAYNFVPSSDPVHGYLPWQLGVVGADGNEPHVILADPDSYLYAPTWTPDGRIVFVSAPVDGAGAASPTHDALEVVNADGTGRRVIVSNLNAPIPAAAPSSVARHASANPDDGGTQMQGGGSRADAGSSASPVRDRDALAPTESVLASAPTGAEGSAVAFGQVAAAPDRPRAPNEGDRSTRATDRFPAAAVAAALIVGMVVALARRRRAASVGIQAVSP